LLAGPPLIGMIGEVLTLRMGVAVIGIAALLIASLAGILGGNRVPAPSTDVTLSEAKGAIPA
jgi:hypothetical protein